jgi:hypothetical protein
MKIITRSLKKRIGNSLLIGFVLGCIISYEFSTYKRSEYDVNLFDYNTDTILGVIIIWIIVGVALYFSCKNDLWEVALSEIGIRLRNSITGKTRFIKYDEIKKVKIPRYSVGLDRESSYCQLEIELKNNKKNIEINESVLSDDIRETCRYIQNKVYEVSLNNEHK